MYMRAYTHIGTKQGACGFNNSAGSVTSYGGGMGPDCENFTRCHFGSNLIALKLLSLSFSSPHCHDYVVGGILWDSAYR